VLDRKSSVKHAAANVPPLVPPRKPGAETSVFAPGARPYQEHEADGKAQTAIPAEFFNIINHTNLGLQNPATLANPAPLAFNLNPALSAVGTANDPGSVGLTNTSSRQIQFALERLF